MNEKQPVARGAEAHTHQETGGSRRGDRFARPEPTWHPYRVTSDHRRGRPLKPKQETILAALAHRCPRPGDEVTARVLAEDTGLRLGSLVLSIRHLVTLKLAIEHPVDEGEDAAFSPSLLGRARIKNAHRPVVTPRRPA